MNFEQVLRALLQELEQRKIRYAVIGGFAVGSLGLPRATMDLDVLIHRDDLASLDEAMRRLGYRCGNRTENVSMYLHPEAAWGRIDCLHAFRTYTVAMLERALSRPVLGGTQTIKVLAAEDVIGLKVQGMANNPQRRPSCAPPLHPLLPRLALKRSAARAGSIGADPTVQLFFSGKTSMI